MNKKSILYLLTAILLLSSCTQGVPKEKQTKEKSKWKWKQMKKRKKKRRI